MTGWLAEGFGCVIVTSARRVEKSLSVTSRSIRPTGGGRPGEVGARVAMVISCETGKWADRIIEAMH